MSPKPRRNLDLLLLGTGTSSSIPLVGCLTSPETGCHCCRSTLNPNDKDGQKNRRRNTSAVLRIKPDKASEDQSEKTVLIDCGKTFLASAIDLWPKKGLRNIDAVILTHAHADAILGLDDLRGWTLRGAIQPSIPIYLTQETFVEVSKAFPYLTNAGKATGGGDIPALTWHIFKDDEPFELFGVEVMPLPVHHGKFFTTPPKPYFCLSFLFDSQILYMSDVSYIPTSVWETLGTRLRLPESTITSTSGAVANGNTNGRPRGMGKENNKGQEDKPVLQALVIDCLRLEPFTSHFGLGQAVATARQLGVDKSYLFGFGHRTSHTLWLSACQALSTTPHPPSRYPSSPSIPIPPPTFTYELSSGHPDPRYEDVEVFRERALQAVESWRVGAGADEGGLGGREVEKDGEKVGGVWVRPAVDGMTITTGERVGDDEYDGDTVEA
ncbi:hypothetical protein JCM11641_002325 [Rhodosporidiobolus odoratus]